MDSRPLREVITNIDTRLERVEQCLPDVATKSELGTAVRTLAKKTDFDEAVGTLATRAALDDAVTKLATKEELHAALTKLATKEELHAAVSELATKRELHAAVSDLATKGELREEGERTRRHFDVVAEGLRDELRLLADSHMGHVELREREREQNERDHERLERSILELKARLNL